MAEVDLKDYYDFLRSKHGEPQAIKIIKQIEAFEYFKIEALLMDDERVS